MKRIFLKQKKSTTKSIHNFVNLFKCRRKQEKQLWIKTIFLIRKEIAYDRNRLCFNFKAAFMAYKMVHLCAHSHSWSPSDSIGLDSETKETKILNCIFRLLNKETTNSCRCNFHSSSIDSFRHHQIYITGAQHNFGDLG